MNRHLELLILAAGLVCVVLFASIPLFWPDIQSIDWEYLRKLRFGAGTFYGASATDIAADIVGMRALATGGDPYPVLGPALKELGLTWDLDFNNPHLPMTYLFAAPVAFLPWHIASAAWALLMMACWIVALRLLGLSWNLAVGVGGLILLWPPATLSLGQLTALWLLFFALAMTWERKHPARAGAAIAMAAMTKITPTIFLVNLASKGKTKQATFGFLLVVLALIAIVFALNPSALARYAIVNQSNAATIIEEPANAAPVAVAWRALGWLGVAGWLAFTGLILWRNWQLIRGGTRAGWIVSAYLAVALLPILWAYSLLPLLPVAWHNLAQRSNLSRALTLGGIALSFAGPAFGPGSVLLVCGCVILFGFSLVVEW